VKKSTEARIPFALAFNPRPSGGIAAFPNSR